MRLALAMTIAAVVASAGPGWADDTSEDAAYKAITEIVSFTPPDAKAKPCTVDLMADFSKYVGRVGVFRDAFLNKEYSVDFYEQRRRQVFAYIVLKRAAELITEGLYSGQERTECRFSITIDYADKFGQDRKVKAISWQFNSAQSAKINWDKFDPRNFADVALDYHMDPAVADWVSDEPQMGDDGRGAPSKSVGCDMLMFSANAMFIRATSFCRKDYMDSPEGLAALEAAKQCPMDDKAIEQRAKTAMTTLDQIARQKGRTAVCPFVDQVAREVRAKMN